MTQIIHNHIELLQNYFNVLESHYNIDINTGDDVMDCEEFKQGEFSHQFDGERTC